MFCPVIHCQFSSSPGWFASANLVLQINQIIVYIWCVLIKNGNQIKVGEVYLIFQATYIGIVVLGLAVQASDFRLWVSLTVNLIILVSIVILLVFIQDG